MLKLTIHLLLLILSFQIKAQTVSWEKYYHFNRDNGAGFAQETQDRGYLLPIGLGNNDPKSDTLSLLKINKYGDVEWKRIIGCSPGYISSFIRTNVNEYLLLYHKDSTDDVIILACNDSAEILWKVTYPSKVGNFVPSHMFVLVNGEYLLQGTFFDSSWTEHHPLILQKFDKNHHRIWSDTLRFPGTPSINDMIVMHDHTLLIGGCIFTNRPAETSHSILLMLDTNGRLIREISYPYNADSSEELVYVRQLKNGDIITQSTEWSQFPLYFTRLDSTGRILHKYESPDLIFFTGGIEADGDSIYHLNSIGLTYGPIVLVKYDSGFNIIRYKYFDDKPFFINGTAQILRTSDGGLLLVCDRYYLPASKDLSFSDIYLIKLNSKGELEKQSKVDNECSLVYPNPARNIIHFDHHNLPDSSLVYSSKDSISYVPYNAINLDIFDSRGRLVVSYPHIEQSGEDKDISWLANGLYLYRLYNDKKVYCTGKFIKE